MPYDGPNDPNLPSNVKKLPADKRRQWIAVWNSAYKNCTSPTKGGGAGNPKDCEGVAFRFANGVVKTKELTVEEDVKEGRTISSANMKILQDAFAAIQAVLTAGEPKVKVEEKALDEKCSPEMPSPPVDYSPKPLGGALTLKDAADWRAAQSVQNQVMEGWHDFDSVYQNIRNADDDEMPRDKKLAAMQALAAEFSSTMADIRPEKKSLFERVKEKLLGEVDEEEELQEDEKHLPGKHNQKVHGRGSTTYGRQRAKFNQVAKAARELDAAYSQIPYGMPKMRKRVKAQQKAASKWLRTMGDQLFGPQ